MKRKIKLFFQLLLAILSAIILIGLAGLWRLSLSPIKFDSHSPILRYVPESIHFSEIFLKSGKFYTIPELELKNVRFKTENVEIKASRIFATWQLWSVLKGDFRISSVRFEESDVMIENTLSKTEENTSIGQQLNDVFKSIPVKYLELTHSNISFYYEENLNRIDQADLYILKFSKATNFQLSGRLGKGVLHPFDFTLKGQVESGSNNFSAEIECKKIVVADLPLPVFIKEKAQFYTTPLEANIIFNQSFNPESFYFKGTVRLDSLDTTPCVVFIRGEKKEKDLFSLNIASPRIDVAALPKVWLPVGVEMRKWVFDSVSKGTGQNINLNFVFQSTANDSFVLKEMTGEIDAEEASVLYMKELPPVERASAHISFNKETASIRVHRAYIKDLKIVDSEINLSQLQVPVPHLDGKIHFTGPFTDLVWYLNYGLLKKNLPGKMKVQAGQVKGQVYFSVPLKEKPVAGDIGVEVEAALQKGDFSFKHGERTLVLKSTDLTLHKKQDRLKVTGAGNVGGFNSSFLWEENYEPNSFIKSRKQLNGSGAFKGLLDIVPLSLQSHIQTQKGGEAALSFTAEENKEGVTKVELDLDLAKTSVGLPLLNWAKSKGEAAKLEIDLETKNNHIHRFKRLSFMSKGLKVQGNARFDEKGKVCEIYFSPLLINGLKGEGRASMKNGIWEIVARFPFLNFNSVMSSLRSSSNNSQKKKDGVSLNLDLKVSTLFFKQNYVYKNLDIVSKIRQNELHFLKITGYDQEEPLSVRYQPYQDQMVLEVEIPRLDTLLEGLEISDQIKSKKVLIQASKPLNDLERPIKGKLFIEQLKVLNAPVFTKLLSLISIEGLVRTLNGTGLVFDDNYAKFEYKDQQIALRRARMMNSSIGITAKGYLDLKGKTLDLEGVLVPANFLNQLLGKIPLIGTLLTGGKDQGLFSVSYTAKGDLKKPKIKSNPLGVVAPNILKSLFGDLTGKKKEKPTLVAASQE